MNAKPKEKKAAVKNTGNRTGTSICTRGNTPYSKSRDRNKRKEIDSWATLFNIIEVGLTYKVTVPPSMRKTVKSSMEAYEVVRPWFEDNFELKEYFYLMLLNQANQVICISRISEGGITGTVADIRLILSLALQTLAVQMIVFHNHPSGNPNPSYVDRELTFKLRDASSLMDIKLLDHLIVTKYQYLSLADEGLI